MYRLILVFVLFFSFCLNLDAQQITAANSDCRNAIKITDTVWGPVNAPAGSGEKMEIYGPANSPYFFKQEHHTVWYYFDVPYTGSLDFDIIPEDIGDDYDFILFRVSDTGFCSHPMKYKPVRSCISRNDSTIGSKTGLSATAVGNHYPQGKRPSYCQELEVKKGERYYLVLDNVYENGKGHSIHFHYKSETIKPVPNKATVNFSVRDEQTKELINADIEIYQLKNKLPFVLIKKFSNTMNFSLPLDYGEQYSYRISSEGYLSIDQSFAIPDTQRTLYINALLKPLHKGDTLIFENIYFYGNEAVMLPESFPVIENIYNTLHSNPGMTIEIRGNVNAPLSRYEPGANMQLSEDRAKAVYNALVQKGISPKRMTYKGYANYNMLYPYAWKEEEMKMNRRVDVLIVTM